MQKLQTVVLSLILFSALTGCSVTPLSIPTTVATPAPTVELDLAVPEFPPTYTPAPSPTADTRFFVYKSKGQAVMIWHAWMGARGTALQQMVREFNADNPNSLRVELKAWGSEQDLLNALDAAPAGEGPNIVVLPPEVIRGQTAADGSILDLLPYLKNEDSEIRSDLLNQIPASLWEPVRVQSAVYGLPAEVASPVLIYNRTWAEELGYTQPPTTWVDFEAQLCAAATLNNHSSDRRNRGTGGWLQDNTLLTDLGWLSAAGEAMPYTHSDNSSLASPAVEDVLTRLKSLSLAGCTWSGRNPTPITYFTQRKALMISLPAGKVQAFEIAMRAAEETDEWSVISYPNETGAGAWLMAPTYYSILPRDAQADLAAWLVLRWLSLPENELSLSLSDGSLPASTANWQAAIQAGTLPPPLTEWMSSRTDPVVGPYLADWTLAGEVFYDGFNQIYQSNLTAEQIPPLLQSMDDFLKELEQQTWLTLPAASSTSTPTAPATPTPAAAAGASSSSTMTVDGPSVEENIARPTTVWN